MYQEDYQITNPFTQCKTVEYHVLTQSYGKYK